jgi:hypothetical protein
MNFINFDELNKEREDKLKKMLEGEKKVLPKCKNVKVTNVLGNEIKKVCNAELVFDEIWGKHFCPVCDGSVGDRLHKDGEIHFSAVEAIRSVNSKNMLTAFDYRHLDRLSSDKLIKILKSRDCQFNYLHHDWAEATKGDKKAEFFRERLKESQVKLEKLGKIIVQLERFLEKENYVKMDNGYWKAMKVVE